MNTDTSHRLNSSDPIEPTPMMLPITRIREYDRNPLTSTRRSGEEDRDYMIHAGGNTRLRILKELY